MWREKLAATQQSTNGARRARIGTPTQNPAPPGAARAAGTTHRVPRSSPGGIDGDNGATWAHKGIGQPRVGPKVLTRFEKGSIRAIRPTRSSNF